MTTSMEVPTSGGRARPRLVILGSGWGAVSFVKALDEAKYRQFEVVLVSPRNYFMYSPLLPAAATGAVEGRSIVEPIRKQLASRGGTYYEATALKVDPERQRLTCRAADVESEAEKGLGGSCPWHAFELEYDFLVTCVGSVPNTFGVRGVRENASFFKELGDATRLRREVTERFERAALPGTPPQRMEEMLTFVVVGAGPTGVELSAELHDMIRKDMGKMYPERVVSAASVHIVDLQEKILSTYDRSIAEYATEHFKRADIKLHLNKTVNEVGDGVVTLTDNATKQAKLLPFGLCVWCTGIELNPLCKQIISALHKEQTNTRSLLVDKHLRVKGSGGRVFAVGDCATVERPKSLDYAERLFTEGDTSGDMLLQRDELEGLLKAGAEEFPHLQEFTERSNYQPFLPNGKDELTLDEFKTFLTKVDGTLRAFPATAQVAKQQGEFLAATFNSFGAAAADPAAQMAGSLEDVPTFRYNHKGSLAYIGRDSAVADIPGFATVKGWSAGLIWKSFETISQVSVRNIFLVAADMARCLIFGRDVSRL